MKKATSTSAHCALALLAFSLACELEQETVDIPPTISYQAQLTKVNPQLTPDDITGTVDITIVGDSVTFTIAATGLPPDIMHLQHIHGFRDNSDAICADSSQDANNDGVVDLMETQLVSGVTLIPLHDEPTTLNLISDTYPVAGEDGTLNYQKTVSRSALEKQVLAVYGIYDLVFDQRVVYIHTIADTVDLPQSVQSLQEVPAHLTVPIACGVLTDPQHTDPQM